MQELIDKSLKKVEAIVWIAVLLLLAMFIVSLEIVAMVKGIDGVALAGAYMGIGAIATALVSIAKKYKGKD